MTEPKIRQVQPEDLTAFHKLLYFAAGAALVGIFWVISIWSQT